MLQIFLAKVHHTFNYFHLCNNELYHAKLTMEHVQLLMEKCAQKELEKHNRSRCAGEQSERNDDWVLLECIGEETCMYKQ